MSTVASYVAKSLRRYACQCTQGLLKKPEESQKKAISISTMDQGGSQLASLAIQGATNLLPQVANNP